MRQGPKFRHTWRAFPGTKICKAGKEARPSHRSSAGGNLRRRAGVTGGVSTPNRQGRTRAGTASTPAPFSLEPGPPFLRVCLVIRGGRSLGSRYASIRRFWKSVRIVAGEAGCPGLRLRGTLHALHRVVHRAHVSLMSGSFRSRTPSMIPQRPAWHEPAGRSVATPLDASKRGPSPLGRHAGDRKHPAAGASAALPEDPSCYHG